MFYDFYERNDGERIVMFMLWPLCAARFQAQRQWYQSNIQSVAKMVNNWKGICGIIKVEL